MEDDYEIPAQRVRYKRLPKQNVDEVILHPELTLQQAKDKWELKRLTLENIKYQPKVSTFFRTPDGEAKLLLLKRILPKESYDAAYTSVRKMDYSKSRRECLKGKPWGNLPVWPRRQSQSGWPHSPGLSAMDSRVV